jgi:hypothetical protein
MYGIGYSHSNFWGIGKSTGWGLYVAAAGVVKATISDSGIWTAGSLSIAVNCQVGNAVNVAGLLHAKSIQVGELTKSSIYLETKDQTTSAIQAGYYKSGGTFVATHLRINNQGGDVSIGSSTSSVYIHGNLTAPKKYFNFPSGTKHSTIYNALVPYKRSSGGGELACIGTYDNRVCDTIYTGNEFKFALAALRADGIRLTITNAATTLSASLVFEILTG